MKITLPYPPALNSLYRSSGKHWYISKKAKLYKESDYYLVRNVIGLKSPYFAVEPLSLKVYIYPPDKRKRDIDGIFKALLDSLTKAELYTDDSQIKRLYAEMRDKREGGQVDIEIDIIG
jgi:crossover junction endodeoxyribonuclease RusA